jgi:hypothetical protein
MEVVTEDLVATTVVVALEDTQVMAVTEELHQELVAQQEVVVLEEEVLLIIYPTVGVVQGVV